MRRGLGAREWLRPYYVRCVRSFQTRLVIRGRAWARSFAFSQRQVDGAFRGRRATAAEGETEAAHRTTSVLLRKDLADLGSKLDYRSINGGLEIVVEADRVSQGVRRPPM